MLEYILNDDGNDIILKDILQRLTSGQVGILPTDTVYGIVCKASHNDGKERIYDLKQRQRGKPMQYLISSLDDCQYLQIDVTPGLEKLAEAFWPGPLTIVINNSLGESHGIRIPGHDFSRKVIQDLGEPLIATSANRSGNDPIESAETTFSDLNGEPDFAVLEDGRHSPASTVMFLKADGSFEIIREGDVTAQQISDVLG